MFQQGLKWSNAHFYGSGIGARNILVMLIVCEIQWDMTTICHNNIDCNTPPKNIINSGQYGTGEKNSPMYAKVAIFIATNSRVRILVRICKSISANSCKWQESANSCQILALNS